MRNTLSKSEILRGRNAFAEIIRDGKLFADQSVACYVASQNREAAQKKTLGGPHIRVGFVAPKKNFPRAVERNKVKRMLREVYRINKGSLIQVTERENRYLRMVIVFRGKLSRPESVSLFGHIESQWLRLVPQIISSL